MPIKNRDLGKYKKPGIFIEEIDASVIELPIQDVLVNLVPGFSKKGPFNAPIYITNPTDFQSIFGAEDKRLENKGSYFHKTVQQMLKSGPVWALNLLNTDVNRDKLEWQTISVSAQYENSGVMSSAYELFFNRQDFWERDTDAFSNIVKNNNNGVQDDKRLFHITNMSDKDITVFMFKSSIVGFDVTAESWYGDRTKVPLYMDYRELISDYMVSIVVLAGDWTDYRTLSNDTTFTKHFNKNGLIKGQVSSFLNERTVSTLASYDVSLIPYFKDLNGRDMYIKNVINNNTDKTGLFCTYNEEVLLEADFKLGNLDILGDVLVGEDKESINFMSYSETLKEALTYQQKYLDSANNVFANTATPLNILTVTGNTRSGAFANGHTYGIYVDDVNGITGTTTTIDFDITTMPNPYYILGGSVYNPEFTEASLTAVTQSTQYAAKIDVLYLTSDYTSISVLNGVTSTSNLSMTTATAPNYTYSLNSTTILGYATHSKSGGTYTVVYTPVTVGTTGATDQYGNITRGFIPVDNFTFNSVTGTNIDNYLEIEFLGTANMRGVYNDYDYLRSNQLFVEMDIKMTTDETVLIKNAPNFELSDKTPITGRAVVDSTASSNALVRLNVDVPSDYISGSSILIYYVDDEFVMQDDSTARLKTVYQEVTQVPQVTLEGELRNVGIVGKYSTFYQNYYNGIINSLDYFWRSNDSTSVLPEDKFFLQMFMDQSDVLTVDFQTFDGAVYTYQKIDNWNTVYGNEIIVYSDKSNWKQSVEVESWVADDLTTVQQIYINKTRYSEIKRGDYLEAYYDLSNWQSGGAGYLEGSVPRKFTRILDIKNDTVDTSLKILYTDAPIRLTDRNMLSGTTSGQSTATADYQTFTYPSIDTYVSNYKGLKISPFIVHQDSIPNGTDSRQNSILNSLSQDTNLAKALADKNKISWRYLVDPWGLGIEPIDGFGCKQQLVDLTGMKLNALGFLNMPSAKDFKDSSNPSFTNDDGSLNLEYVMEGANQNINPDYLFQFATRNGEVDGRSTAGYFFPYVRIYDDGIPKWFPPASYAATTYMQKFISSVAGFSPWTICAGITNGRINGITKTEMDFNGEDLEYLHQMGANPIVYKLNNGYCINDESSAQVYPTSSLSFLHSREALIELENRLYDMLLRYQWSFNTPEIRAEIKYKADKICKEMLDGDALYDFKNICDESNNTDYIIDLQMGVLDTYIEIIKGMGIIVNNITILKKGDIQSGGFTTA